MPFELRRWTREALLARLEANDAIDAAADVDAPGAARDRLRLLGVGDRLETLVLTPDEAMDAFHRIRDDARAIVEQGDAGTPGVRTSKVRAAR